MEIYITSMFQVTYEILANLIWMLSELSKINPSKVKHLILIVLELNLVLFQNLENPQVPSKLKVSWYWLPAIAVGNLEKWRQSCLWTETSKQHSNFQVLLLILYILRVIQKSSLCNCHWQYKIDLIKICPFALLLSKRQIHFSFTTSLLPFLLLYVLYVRHGSIHAVQRGMVILQWYRNKILIFYLYFPSKVHTKDSKNLFSCKEETCPDNIYSVILKLETSVRMTLVLS
jgi:hypothetical protein